VNSGYYYSHNNSNTAAGSCNYAEHGESARLMLALIHPFITALTEFGTARVK
jgi:hypothetical protein